ncbi:MAG: hypothetical protein M3P34_09620 [Actinomycetota bacterium]|nr:hypothetical protein [Actinomycetota bacterium]
MAAPRLLSDLGLPATLVQEIATSLRCEIRPARVARARRHLYELSWEDGRVAWEIAGQLLLLSQPA